VVDSGYFKQDSGNIVIQSYKLPFYGDKK